MLVGFAPTLDVVAAVMVAERITTFGVTGPAVRVLYTVVEPDEKYTAQNFIDTVVYRGGDAASGYLVGLLGTTLGLGTTALALAIAPFAGLWLFASLGLAWSHRHHAAKSP